MTARFCFLEWQGNGHLLYTGEDNRFVFILLVKDDEGEWGPIWKKFQSYYQSIRLALDLTVFETSLGRSGKKVIPVICSTSLILLT